MVIKEEEEIIEVVIGPGEREVTSTLTFVGGQPFQSNVGSCNATNEVGTEVATADLIVYSEWRDYVPFPKCLCPSLCSIPVQLYRMSVSLFLCMSVSQFMFHSCAANICVRFLRS